MYAEGVLHNIAHVLFYTGYHSIATRMLCVGILHKNARERLRKQRKNAILKKE